MQRYDRLISTASGKAPTGVHSLSAGSARSRNDARRAVRLAAALLFLYLGLFLPMSVSAQGQVVHQGTWTTKGFDVDGTWKIVRDGGKTWVVLDEAFSTKSAPDLKIFLSPNATEGLDNRNATRGSQLVAVLTSHRGAQRYEVPADVELQRFRSIVLHCEKYTKLWAAADLR
ncbi:MAG: DM13 domain-containing protein [Thermoanaerobaculia bacterium]|nr:DM13 domain-containing protein [Thermoanaerobaculia bacterium]